MRMERQHSRSPFSIASPDKNRHHETKFRRQKQNMVLVELNGLWADNKVMEY